MVFFARIKIGRDYCILVGHEEKLLFEAVRMKSAKMCPAEF